MSPCGTFSAGDLDNDGLGDACDSDRDGDRVPNRRDNCPDAGNANQADIDQMASVMHVTRIWTAMVSLTPKIIVEV